MGDGTKATWEGHTVPGGGIVCSLGKDGGGVRRWKREGGEGRCRRWQNMEWCHMTPYDPPMMPLTSRDD